MEVFLSTISNKISICYLAQSERLRLQQVRFKPVQVIYLYGCLVIHAVFAVFFSQNAAAGAEHIGQGQLVIGQQYLNGAHTVCQNLVNFGRRLSSP